MFVLLCWLLSFPATKRISGTDLFRQLYLRGGSVQTIVRAATLRYKLQANLQSHPVTVY